MDFISAEHAKQLNWRDSLKLQEDELQKFNKEIAIQAKEKFAEEEKIDADYRVAKRNMEIAQDEAKLKGTVNAMVNDVSAGEKTLHSVVRTLSEFLSKKK